MGRGLSTSENVAIGSGVAVVFTIFMCTCGLPLIVTGVILIQISVSQTAGIIILAISSILILITIVMIILICAGVFNKESEVSPHIQTRTLAPNNVVPIQPPPYACLPPQSPPPVYAPQQLIVQPGKSSYPGAPIDLPSTSLSNPV